MPRNTNQPRLFFIYGNQSLELKEKAEDLIDKLLPKTDREHSLFQFDAEEFFQNAREKTEKALSHFQNVCDTFHFFSSKVVVYLRNLEKIPQRKFPAEKIEKLLSEINLVKTEVDDHSFWLDATGLSQAVQTRRHISGKNIVKKIIHCGGNVFYLELDPFWNKKVIYRQKGKDREAVEINEYLKSALKAKITFQPPEESALSSAGDGKFITLLKECVTDPPPQIYFVFSANIRHLRELNREISQLLKTRATQIKTTVAYDDFKPVSWIINRARGKKLRLERDAADLLIEISGSDLSALDMELTKLSILFPPGSEITPEHLLQSAGYSKQFHIFRTSDFLAKKDLKNTLESLEMLLKKNPADSVPVFSLIASQFRRLLKISWMLELGNSEKVVIEKIKINPWIAKQLIQYAKNFTRVELENIVIHLSDCDLRVKYSAKEALVILENLCFQICRGAFQNKRRLDRPAAF